MPEPSKLILANWVLPDEQVVTGECYIRDGETLPASLQHLIIVLDKGSEAHAGELLERGASCVLLADAAMLDSTAVTRLVQQYGAERVGVSLTAKKRHVSWTMDMVSNADFRCLTPSYGKDGWEIVMSDGTATGTDAEWWVGQMLALGASMALIHADVDDDDLNLCAGLVETHGSKLWFTPWQQPEADLEPWVRYGQMRQILLPEPNTRDENEMARILAAGMPEQDATAMAENENGAAAKT